MQLSLTAEKIEKANVDLVILPLFEGKIEKGNSAAFVDSILAGLLSDTLKKEEFKGKPGDIKTLHTHYKIKAPYVLVLGLGEIKKFNQETLRKACGKAVATAVSLKSKKILFPIAECVQELLPLGEVVQAASEGLLLGSYRFDEYKSKKEESSGLSDILYLLPDHKVQKEALKALRKAEILSEAACFARHLVNTPSEDMAPEILGKHALKIKGIKTRVYKQAELKKLGMGGIVNVGKGAKNPPVLIEMIYKPKAKAKKVIALIGKGVTFDSGGLSLKPPKSMETMKDDMAGAAALLGTMQAIAQLQPQVEVHAYVPSAENMPDANAIRPGDVIKAYNGKTVEVLNTDAEGRLILMDALAFAAEKKPDFMVDLATLTGACLVAVGELYTAILGTDKEHIEKLISSGKKCGELIWELPLVEEYKDDMKSNIADLQNIGGAYAGSIMGGLFLQEFVGKTPWAHMDIAGPSWANKPWAYCPKGGTGIMVRTLCEYLMGF
ncbi:MAG: leucyl aminopeptidase [Deltaproteobacteria bacterium]|nr:leucyl aminopeptidase [Deltaproteobacteria bacterium]